MYSIKLNIFDNAFELVESRVEMRLEWGDTGDYVRDILSVADKLASVIVDAIREGKSEVTVDVVDLE